MVPASLECRGWILFWLCVVSVSASDVDCACVSLCCAGQHSHPQGPRSIAGTNEQQCSSARRCQQQQQQHKQQRASRASGRGCTWHMGGQLCSQHKVTRQSWHQTRRISWGSTRVYLCASCCEDVSHCTSGLLLCAWCTAVLLEGGQCQKLGLEAVSVHVHG
jgi:hypothetical protein